MTSFGAPRDSLFASPQHGGDPGRTDAAPLARRTDPATSKRAAREILPALSTLQAQVLDHLRANGGLTATELAQRANWPDPRRANRRLTELVRDGRVVLGCERRCNVTGKRVQTYWAASEVK